MRVVLIYPANIDQNGIFIDQEKFNQLEKPISEEAKIIDEAIKEVSC